MIHDDGCQHVGQINTIDPVQDGDSSAVLATFHQGPGNMSCLPALAALPNNALVGGDTAGCLHFFTVNEAAIRPSGMWQAHMCGPYSSLQTVHGHPSLLGSEAGRLLLLIMVP